MWKSRASNNSSAFPQPASDIIQPDVEDPPPQRQPRTIHNMAPQPQQSAFPEHLPPRPEQTGDSRLCPGARFCWSFSWEAWSLQTNGDYGLLTRRICMWVTLAVRTMTSVLGLVFSLYGGSIGGFVIGTVFTVLGFFFIAYCLAGIGNVQGTRRVLGISMGRWHYDIFLLGSAAIHVALIFIVFFLRSSIGFMITWYGMWLLIFATFWTTTWTPEQQSYV